MNVIAEFIVKADDFALHHALTTAPEMIVEIERVVATIEDRVMPYFWVHGGDHHEFEDAFHDDESVTNITALDAVDDVLFPERDLLSATVSKLEDQGSTSTSNGWSKPAATLTSKRLRHSLKPRKG